MAIHVALGACQAHVLPSSILKIGVRPRRQCVSHVALKSTPGVSRKIVSIGSHPSSFFLSSRLYNYLGSAVFSENGTLELALRSRHRQTKQRENRLLVQAAVFDQLSESLEQVWEKLRSQDKLTKENIKEPMREIRRALLEADVSLPVVRRFVKSVTDKAVGVDVVKGVRPDQQLVKVVHDELKDLMGGAVADLEFKSSGPTVILMAGLQGVGKTTACGKLSLFLKKKGKKCMLVATDIYRPAAIDQLIKLGSQVEVPVFSLGQDVNPVEIARRGLEEATKQQIDVVIVDTAGRLQINTEMMEELKQIKKAVKPSEVLLVVDAMTGQEAAGLVASFNASVGITGAILTKLDGDSRGGAALSVREVSGKPIKFVGEGEGMQALDPFYPERMAGRILGMGDVLTLVEKAQELMVKEEQEDLQKRILEAKFDFNDFLKQTKMMARMGSVGSVLNFIPGAPKLTPQQLRDAEKSLKIVSSIINSMTPEERRSPDLLAKSPSRRRRIANGSGRSQEQVSQLVSQLFTMRAQMQKVSALMSGKSIPGIPGLDDSGRRKASPGTAKRKRSRSGFQQQLEMATSATTRTKGFGGKSDKKI